ncbi:DUF3313 domain-containing protein [Klebsiella aerogenes]|uniref:DUF3313 domain-containing protein n=1 Tax=Klebsiella aerogenes TaxID=548 RepID=UPI001F1A7D92|nr:DUF3313 domain-containing protein [Klebsiella aerogenes]
MYRKSIINIVILSGALALAGCTSKITQPEKYSGFLKDYSDLKEMSTPSGEPELRWVDPNFNPANYDNIVYNPITYYPEPRMSTQVGKQALDRIRQYTDMQIKTAIAQRKPLVTQPGPRSLIFRGAITGVDLSKQGLQFYEVIPAALLVAGLETVTGHRTAETRLYFEAELIDARTHKPVFKAVRKGEGKDLPNQNVPLTKETLKTLIDKMASDIVNIDLSRNYQVK